VHAIIFSVPSFCSQFVCLDSGSDNSSVRRAIGGEIGVRDRVVRTIVEVHTLHTHLTRTLRIQHGTHLLLRKSIAYEPVTAFCDRGTPCLNSARCQRAVFVMPALCRVISSFLILSKIDSNISLFLQQSDTQQATNHDHYVRK
jgi:hypothetical protein